MWCLLVSYIFEICENWCSHCNHYGLLLILQATQLDLHRHFYALGAGVIEEVRVQRDKGFGFVRFSTHAEAALAIQMGNAQSYLCGKLIKVGFSPVDAAGSLLIALLFCLCFMIIIAQVLLPLTIGCLNTVLLGEQADSTRNCFKSSSPTCCCAFARSVRDWYSDLREADSNEQDGWCSRCIDASPSAASS